MSSCTCLPKTQQYLEKEVHEARADIRRLQEEIAALRQKVIDLRQSLHYERCQNKMHKRKYEDVIKCSDLEKKNILSKQDELISKIQVLESTVECLNKRVQDMIAENVRWQSQCNHLKSINERLEKSKRKIENSASETEDELTKVKQRIKTIEDEKRSLCLCIKEKEKEIQNHKDNCICLMRENEHLKECLEAKSTELSKLEKDKSKKYNLINQFEEKISKLNCEIIRSNGEEKRAQKEISTLKKELQAVLECKSSLQIENQKLFTCLEAMNRKLQVKECDYEKATDDLANLREKINNYADQFKKVEKIIGDRCREKEELSHQLRQLEAKVSNLESANQALENENGWTDNNLRTANCKIEDLQNTIRTKESIIRDMECQMKELSKNIRSVKHDLSKQQQKNMKLSNELTTSKDVISSMESQQKNYETEMRKMENKVEQVTTEINKSQSIIQELTNQLEAQKRTISSLELAVSESRREAREESLQNLNVSQKVQELHDSVHKLQEKLCCVNNALAKCQNTCSEYKSQNDGLQFQFVNDKYANAFRTHCFYGNKDKTIECSCSSSSECKDFLKTKATFAPIKNDEADIDFGKGKFTISVDKAPSVPVTIQNKTRPRSPIEGVFKRKSSSESSASDEELKIKNKIHKKSDSYSRCDELLKTPSSLARLKEEANLELKSILKSKSRLLCGSPNKNKSSLDTSISDLCKSKGYLTGVHCCSIGHKSSNCNSSSSKHCSSDNITYPSIADESPPYSVKKKCYKKVCFSESDEDS